MFSRNGVCYNLEKSPYRVTIGNLTFVFSSELHEEKFRSKVEANRDVINYSLSKRFNFNVDVSALADIVLYRKIETRGFLIEEKDVKMQCLKSVRYVGGKATSTSCKRR